MPTIACTPQRLHQLLGVEYAEGTRDPETHMNEQDKKMGELVMSFGLDLEVDIVDDVLLYKIDIPANRPDLLSVEGIAISLKVFQGGEHPKYTIVPPQIEIRFDESVSKVRPFLICAVLRDVTFTPENYASFIDFQDKLHMNLARQRTLASIGTHDLDTAVPPFVYRADKPEDIKFVPLTLAADPEGHPNQHVWNVDGNELRANLSKHQQLSKYLRLLDVAPTWPVIRDSRGEVCSMPPIINSDLTKITLDTKNIFIDCTAMDLTRGMNAVLCLVAGFSLYTKTPFTIEQVKVNHGDHFEITPKFETTEFSVDPNYIRELTGLPELKRDDIRKLLYKMMLDTKEGGASENDALIVCAPPTRTDVLHACDIAEDVAIAYGYNNILKKHIKPYTHGKPLVMNQYCDHIREEVARCQWDEINTFSLCAARECFEMLELPPGPCVRLQKAKETQFEIVRTTLLPGLLKVCNKVLNEPNLSQVLPLRLFEISDVVLVDEKAETNTRNERRFCALTCDTKSRFEDIHGLMDRFAVVNHLPPEALKLEHIESPICLPGQMGKVIYRGQEIGWIGVLHPKVLINFGLNTPIAAFEIKVQPFLQ